MNNIVSDARKALESIAIVGIGCRLPGGVSDVESFWSLLVEGRSGIVQVPDERWDIEHYYHPDPGAINRMVSRAGGFVERIQAFDARFWGISPREAARMDPQQRWLLEVAWEAIEDAGIAPSRLRGSRTGVFVGIASHDFADMQLSADVVADVHTNSGSTSSIASNRISYLLDLKGPSLSVDTACSSALTAVALACQSLRSGESEIALVGGVNAIITPYASIGFSRATMLSPSGQCFAFDARADGYVRGEGAGMVLLKPLSRARADGDRIYALIRAAVINQDGHTSSMTVPGIDSQAAMLRQAYDEADIPPCRVSYVEAHGTGTPVGDPIELAALGRVLGPDRPEDAPCLIGSVKTNLGHLEAGAGIVGLIKAALVLQQDLIPPSLNFETPNPNIPFDALRLKVASRLQPLPHDGDTPVVVGVNSFGFGGANAHVVLQSAPDATRDIEADTVAGIAEPAVRPCLLPLSARDDKALHQYVQAFRQHLKHTDASFADLCYSAGAHKEAHGERLFVIGRDALEMRERLADWLRKADVATGLVRLRATPDPAPIVFVFTGQGAQWWAMGQQLLAHEPIFRRTVEAIDARLQPLAGWSLLEEMSRPEADSRVHLTEIAQPAIFALQVGLAALWRSWGIEPSKVIGHSVGEVAAAYCAGAYSLDDAVTIIVQRSRLQSTTESGRMLAAGIPDHEVSHWLGDEAGAVEIAAVNSPGQVTLAGDAEALERVAARLEAAERFVRRLKIDYAFHTHKMDAIEHELLQRLSHIEPRPTRIPLISTVTAGVVPGHRLTAAYWWLNVRQPVRFGSAMTQLIRGGDRLFLEIGPHPALFGAIQECLADCQTPGTVLHSLRRDTDEQVELLTNLARLQAQGIEVDWAAVNQATGRVRLPAYPWTHESHWVDTDRVRLSWLVPDTHPLLGRRIPASTPTWELDLDLRRFVYLNDHRFWDTVVFPAASYGEMGIALGRALFPNDEESLVVEELEIEAALFVSADPVPILRILFEETDKSFAIYSSNGRREDWKRHARGRLTQLGQATSTTVDLAALRARLPDTPIGHERYYAELAAAGYQFGPDFRQLHQIWRGTHEALGDIHTPDSILEQSARYHLHPAMLDACFQVLVGARAIPADADPQSTLYLPNFIRRIRLYHTQAVRPRWAHATLISTNDDSLVGDIAVYDDAGRRIADILGFRAERVEQRTSVEDLDDALYRFHWQPCRLKGRGRRDPMTFPSTSILLDALREHRADVYRHYELDRYYHQCLPSLERIALQFIQNAFIALGWNPRPGDEICGANLLKQLRIVRTHQRLATAELRLLEQAGLLAPLGDDRWRVVQPPIARDPGPELDALTAQFPRLASEIALQRLAGSNLAGVLGGDLDPLQLLFPEGSTQLLADFYLDGFDFPACHALIAQVLTEAIGSLPPRRSLRILEVGAGTGSLTSVVLPLLPSERTEYLFTDIGPTFLAAAKSRFADYDFIDYRPFDIEKDPASQGLPPGSCDVILMTNVLHTASDLRRALLHLKTCLAPGGALIFLEVVARRAVWDNVFGLLSGWWRFADTDLRAEHALLDRPRWEPLLTECGFVDVASFTAPPDDTLGEQAVFIATVPPAADSAPPPAGNGYLVFADGGGVADALIGALEDHGHWAVRVTPGERFEKLTARDFVIDPDQPADLRRLLAEDLLDLKSLSGILHGWALDVPDGEQLETGQLLAAQRTGVLHALQLIQALAARVPETAPRVRFLVRGLNAVVEDDRCLGIAAAPLVGLVRVANNEHPEFRCTLIDLDPRPDPQEIDTLLDEIELDDGELELAYRQGRRHALRLVHSPADRLPKRHRDAIQADGQRLAYRLQIETPGILANLSLNETDRRPPEPHEIEVRVQAGGINFRDVMKALGMYPGHPVDRLWLGDDFAGIVERVGDQVTDLRPGDAVVGMAPYVFRAFATVDRRLVFRKPVSLSFAEAATLPTVFLTAHHAIDTLARPRRGESILIHAATGGVGQAAIQIARRRGLEIFATAGTPEKRRFLADMGIEAVLDSRTLDFADQILEMTNGRGVDIVLNSLAGDFIPKSFSVLAPFGRFLEIGKVDVYNNTRIGLAPLRNNIAYFVIDLAQHLERRPQEIAAMFSELAERFEAGDYQPLPHRVFPIADVVEAFRFMAQGKHIGKNVLSFEHGPIPIGPCTQDGRLFRSAASYLIIGGAGGFSLELAKWMAAQGARHLILMSRSGPRDQGAAAAIETLRATGVQVTDARGDVTRLEDVERIVDAIQTQGPPLAGVVHGAMVLDDAFILKLNAERFRAALDPKMLGAWNLHLATRHLPLEHFIGFSSFSAVIGGAKQANYNAGNSFIDLLAHHRRALGLPALTYDWTALSGAGFVERNAKTAQYLDKLGMKSFTMDEAFRVIRRTLPLDAVQIAACRADWTAFARLSPLVGNGPTFTDVRQRQDEASGHSSRLRILNAAPEQRAALLEDFLTAQVAGVFGIEHGQIDRDAPLASFGLDSLMAVDLMNRVESELSLSLPLGSILSGAGVKDLVQLALRVLDASQAAVDGDARAAEDDPVAVPAAPPLTPKGDHGTPKRATGSSRIDFEAECRLDPEIVAPTDAQPAPTVPRQILLTGATGFIGAFLLDELLKRTDARLHCLTRARDDAAALRRLRDNLAHYALDPVDFEARVAPVVGDLSKPRLGLSEEGFAELAERIDWIYHNGADVNLGLPYQSLRAANVSGTLEILRLAGRSRLKAVHFVSTFTVLATEALRGQRVGEQDPRPPAADLLSGYAQTKWVAEHLIEAARARGIPVSIYRPGHVSGHSRTGAANTSDLLHMILLACWQLGAAPERLGALDMTPVDYVAAGLVELSLHPEWLGGTFHLTNPNPMRMASLLEAVQRENLGIRTIDYDSWRDRLLALAKQTAMAEIQALVDAIIPERGDADVPALHPEYDCRHAQSALAQAGIVCPPGDQRLLERYIEYARRTSAIF